MIHLFVAQNSPDDIVTLVDRDWGSGSGWHKLGFETVNLMPPLVMAVSPKDGQRRHLVGAGIREGTGRLGLPMPVLEELDLIHDPMEAFQYLSFHEFYPVHDAGVERLMMLVANSEASKGRKLSSTTHLWRLSNPCYGQAYYSGNSGIAALLREAEGEGPLSTLDHDEAVLEHEEHPMDS